MTLLKDFNELHVRVKSFLIGWLIVMPFWYFDIFLFYPECISENSIHIPIILSFCISFCYYGLVIIEGAIIGITFIPDIQDADLYLLVVLLSVFWISLFTYLGYLFSWTLMTLIHVTFVSAIGRTIAWFFI